MSISNNIDGIFPLSPLQYGMLFHSFSDPQSGMYVVQNVYEIAGQLDVDAFRRAWEKLIERYDVFRTLFIDLDHETPLQVVRKQVSLPWSYECWDVADEAANRAHLADYLDADRRRGFALQSAPLMRLALFKNGPENHLLVQSYHHALADGWSMPLVLNDLHTLYQGLAAGKTPSLPPVRPYRDYIKWLAAQDKQQAESFWRAYLQGLSTPTPLPGAHYTGAQEEGLPQSEYLSLSEADTAMLVEAARSHQLTPNVLAQAAWGLLLARYSGEGEVLFGAVVSGRPAELAGVATMVGPFLNTMPVRVRVDERRTVRDWLYGLRDDQQAREAYSYSSLIDIHRWSQFDGGAPLFSTLFAFENFPAARGAGAQAPAQPQPHALALQALATLERTNYPLALTVIPGTRLAARLTWDPALYDAAMARQIIGHYMALLLAIARQSGDELTRLEMLSGDQRERLLWDWNPGAHAYPACQPLHAVFDARALVTPDAVALAAGERSVSYAELKRRSDDLAAHLAACGVGCETRVGVCMQRSPELVTALLAVLKAGGAYVPLDPDYPRERLQFILGDSAIDVLLVDAGSAPLLEGVAARIVRADLPAAPVPAGWAPATVSPDNLAYLIYTSGSTGTPKGVAVAHRNVHRLLQATAASFGFGAQDIWCLFHSYAFDFAVWEMWGCLLHGGRLVVLDYWQSRSPESTHAALADQRVTVLNQTPSAFRQLVRYQEDADAHADLALRYVIFGGEALDFQLLRNWYRQHRDDAPRLVNMYGITETTVHVTERMLHAADSSDASSFIGKAIGDLRLLILDEEMRPVPPGVSGQLFVGGAGLARGYWRRPELTADRFVPNPFARVAGERLYKTGDLARYHAGGDIEYLGRLDFQVKVRGFRIELGEIVAALQELPVVREAVVLPHRLDDGDTRLCAYLVPPAGTTCDLRAVRAALGQRLPSHMVPAHMVVLDSFPRTETGKLDRAALPKPDEAHGGSGYRAPRTSAERTLAEIWQRILKRDRIGIDDKFFELGGDSILAIRIVSAAREAGIHFGIQDLFSHQSIALLASDAGSAAETEGTAVAPFALLHAADRERLPADAEDAYPLAAMQLGMVFHHDLDQGAGLYHNVTSFTVPVAYRDDAMRTALASLMDEHELLRTSIHQHDYGVPIQIVHARGEPPLVVEDASGLTAAQQQELLDGAFAHEREARFVLERAPLFRVRIHVLDARSFQFTFTEHHAILDGWSVASALAELLRRYGRLQLGMAPAAAQPAGYYRRFVALEQRVLAAPESRTFWATALQGALASELPKRSDGAGGDEADSGHHGVPLEPLLAQALREAATEAGVPLRTVLLAAHLRTMAFLSGTDDVVVGMVSNIRLEEQGGEDALGLYLNTVPVRYRLRQQSWREAIREVLALEQEIGRHNRYPLAEIQRAAGRQSLFDVLFNFTHFHVLKGNGASASNARSHARTNYKLGVNFVVTPDGREISLELVHDPVAVGGTLARRIGEYHRRALASLASSLDASCLDVELLGDAERTQLLVDWNQTGAPFDDATMHELVARSAARMPDAIAVSCAGAALSYRELDQRAAALAARLAATGVGLESRVGICLRRSPELLVAMLAVLKAGAAYVPLDPAYPAERIQYIVDDGGLAALLTEPALRSTLPATATTLVMVGSDQASPGLATLAACGPANLAYVIYTSGSTGRPKGVGITHRNASAMLGWARRSFARSALDYVVAATSVCFDLSIFELFLPLTVGGCVLIEDDPLSIAESDARHVATLVNTVPSAMSALAAQGVQCPQLEVINLAGEELTRQLVERIAVNAAPRRVDVYNLYGPSEDTTYSTGTLVPQGVPARPTIGRPLDNTRSYVLDANLMPVPMGVCGELFLSGAGVSRGYHGRPDLTAERYLPDPFAGAPGARMYRTGDRVRYLSDSDIEFLGRIDHQVKIRGFRIELGEIEDALRRIEAVRDAVVTDWRDANGNHRLVAYLVVDGTADEAGLRACLQERLPRQMVPQTYVFLDAMPRTPNGKLDRKALSAPDAGAQADRYVAPRTATEVAFAGLWAELLRCERVSATDRFFELGGDSIISILFVARARALGYTVSPRLLLENPTLASLAAASGEQQAPSADQDELRGPVALHPVQHWFLEQGLPDAHHFNQAMLLQPRQALEAGALLEAVGHLLRHHDMLRASLSGHESGAVQEVQAWTPELAAACVASHDFSALPQDDAQRALASAVGQVHAGLDLARAPLIRFVRFQLPAQEERLLVVAHHWTVDGLSWRILLDDLTLCYRACAAGRVPALPPKTTGLGAWMTALTDYARGLAVGQLAHWGAVQAAGTALLSADHADHRQRNTVAQARVAQLELDEEVTRALLQQASAAYRTEINDLLLTGLALGFATRKGTPALFLNLEGHGREDLGGGCDLSRTVGWFTSIYPVLLRLPEQGGTGAALKAVKEQLRAVPDKGIGYGALRHLTPDASGLPAAPQPEISFNYLGQFDQSFGPEALLVPASEGAGQPHAASQPRAHLLDITAVVMNGRLRLSCQYAGLLYGEGEIHDLLAAVAAALGTIVEHCASPESGGLTPSDIPELRLEQCELDELLARAAPGALQAQIEGAYPLSPMQRGVLHQTLRAGAGAGVYVIQSAFELHGRLDPDAWRLAWRQAVQANPITRTRFVDLDRSHPVQLVQKDVEVPYQCLDWSAWPEARRAEAFREWIAADRARGIDIASAPLMRLALIQYGPRRWRMVCTQHQAITDGWSFPLLLKQVMAAYQAAIRGDATHAPAVSRPYRDYIAWLASRDAGAPERYWREHLAGYRAPARSARTLAASAQRQVQRVLDAGVTEQLASFARAEGVTLNALAQAAWGLLLHACTGEQDLVFGTVVAGRPADLPDVETIIGPFVNTVPVRVRVRAQEPLRAYLGRIYRDQLARQSVEHSSLAEIHGWSEVARDTPLFDSLLVYENYPVAPGSGAGQDDLALRFVDTWEQTSYPLCLTIVPGSATLLRLAYDTSRLSEAKAERMLERFEALMLALGRDGGLPAAALPVLTDAESAWLREQGAGPALALDAQETIHGLFERQAALMPDAIAVVEDDSCLSYRALDHMANALAHRLVAAGVGPEARVGICMERSLPMVVGLLAVLKCSAGYVPLDPDYPADRLTYMLEDSGASLLLADAGSLAALPVLAAHPHLVVGVDGRGQAEPPPHAVLVGAMAYATYTSGSTGKPKGVVGLHHGTVNRFRWMWEAVPFGPNEVVSQKTRLGFLDALWELFGGMLQGVRTVIVPGHLVLDAPAFAGELRRQCVSRIVLVPSLLRHLEESGVDLDVALPGLRYWTSSGEALEPAQADYVLRGQVERVLLNLYGSSELAADATCKRMVRPEQHDTASIGRPLANLRAMVLDDGWREVAPGTTGELCVSGPALARGYLGNPDLTAERFVPDPYASEPGARMFLTGDRVHFRENGELVYAGRRDHQVKLRGVRIELGEVQSVLRTYPGVAQALAEVRTDAGNQRLVAYLVPAEGTKLDLADVRAEVARSLPSLMRPNAYQILDKLPLTPSGKVDRMALAALQPPKTDEQQAQAPRTDEERRLHDLWCELLGCSFIGVDTTFIDAGGNSLLVARLLNRIDAEFGVRITMAYFFEHATVMALARYIAFAQTQSSQAMSAHDSDDEFEVFEFDATSNNA